MATFEVVLSQRLQNVLCQMTFHYNNISMGAGVPSAPNELALQFQSTVLPLINAIQSQLVTNVSIYARDLGAPATAKTISDVSVGAVAATLATTMPPHIPLLITFDNGQWVDVINGQNYSSVRPGGRGKNYISGLTEDWSNADGAAAPAALSAAWTALQNELNTTIVLPTGSVVLNHVTWSPGKGALNGLPARNPLVADVTGTNIRYFTRLLSRRA